MPEAPSPSSWRLGGITTPEVEDYLYEMLPPRDEVLVEMEALAAEKNIPIIGPAVARVLTQLAMISGAKTVFELGSAIGYSAIWWARAVGPGGRVIYTDGDRRNADQARRYFERAGVADRITLHTGRACAKAGFLLPIMCCGVEGWRPSIHPKPRRRRFSTSIVGSISHKSSFLRFCRCGMALRWRSRLNNCAGRSLAATRANATVRQR